MIQHNSNKDNYIVAALVTDPKLHLRIAQPADIEGAKNGRCAQIRLICAVFAITGTNRTIDQFNIGHRCLVPGTKTALQNSQVATGTIVIARAKIGE